MLFSSPHIFISALCILSFSHFISLSLSLSPPPHTHTHTRAPPFPLSDARRTPEYRSHGTIVQCSPMLSHRHTACLLLSTHSNVQHPPSSTSRTYNWTMFLFLLLPPVGSNKDWGRVSERDPMEQKMQRSALIGGAVG